MNDTNTTIKLSKFSLDTLQPNFLLYVVLSFILI